MSLADFGLRPFRSRSFGTKLIRIEFGCWKEPDKSRVMETYFSRELRRDTSEKSSLCEIARVFVRFHHVASGRISDVFIRSTKQ
jgi:hypothetical protein